MIQKSDNLNEAKKAAGVKAVEFVKEGMLLGLGTGSTVYYFIEALAQKCREEGLKVQALATSKKSEALAQAHGIPLLSPGEVNSLDLIVDGADEIDSEWRMIKGGGGALLREKIAAFMAPERVIIIDPSKRVKSLGGVPLPTEILPWGKKATEEALKEMGLNGVWREGFLSDNGHPILDLKLPAGLHSPEEWEAHITAIPGVLATGFFFHLASRIIVGYPDGKVEVL